MNVQRDPEAILDSWLEDGPVRLPDTTRRAIVVTIGTTRQEWRPMWAPRRFLFMNGVTRFALGAVAVVAVALGGLYLLEPMPQGGVPGWPSTSPSTAPTASPSAAPLPALDRLFMSPTYGYSVRYPTGWTTKPASRVYDPAAGTQNTAGLFMDALVPPSSRGLLRAGSAQIPPGEDAAEWVDHYICNAQCYQPLETIVIDGQPAFIWTRSDSEVEATVISGDRVYLFTLFAGGDPDEPNVLPNVRATFDEMMATVDLRPEDVIARPGSSPSPAASSSPS